PGRARLPHPVARRARTRSARAAARPPALDADTFLDKVSAADHPSNAGLCRYFRGRGRRDVPAVARPEDVVRPYEALGTHPDLVARLWDEIPTLLPVDCRFILFGTPVLMRPDSE